METNRNITILLVITVIFGTVALGSAYQAYAADSAKIINSVQSSTHTGGQTSSGGQSGQNGANGTDGTRGVDGESGKNGANGVDGAVINGKSSAHTYVKSSTDTESVKKQTVSRNGSTTQATTTIEIEYTDSSKSNLMTTLQHLQLILSKYVSLLF